MRTGGAGGPEMWTRGALAVSLVIAAGSCASAPGTQSSSDDALAATSTGGLDGGQVSTAPPAAPDLPTAEPATEGVGLAPLVAMTDWVIAQPEVPIFSLLLSRHGSLVYEMYTPGIERPEAHFMMSTSKTFVSAIVGAAIDRKYISGTDATVADLLPAKLFGGAADVDRFGTVTLKDVLGMSALDALEPPHDSSPTSIARGNAFAAANNRVTFALTQALLPAPGTSYQYNDITPSLAGGAVQYATGERLFDFASETLFTPMGFENAEWYGEDPTGIDLAAYGLRIRPLDMQKFGMLFNDGGRWKNQQLLSSSWVDTSWTAWMHTDPTVTAGFDNYGWYWWYRTDWGTEAHWTNGWRGQFIVALPEYDAVFTMSADIEDDSELAVLSDLMTRYVVPALAESGSSPALESELAAALTTVHQGASRVNLAGDKRMIPSVAPLGTAIPFMP